MNADLEHLIALQQLDSALHDAERRLADEPARLSALDSRLGAARGAVATAQANVIANQTARRDIDREVILHQGRLQKYRDQSMAVKTNDEFRAIQHQMVFEQNEIKTHEDRMLERMMEADDLAAALKTAEQELGSAQKEVEAERRAIAAEHEVLRGRVDTLRAERAGLVARVSAEALGVFDLISKRRSGIAIAEARDGICTVCHVRLRPQVFNTVRRNEAIIQCDSCQRILFFTPPTAAAPAVP